MQSINIREFKEIIRFTIANGLQQPILGLGAPGIGKSEVIKQIADELDYHLEDLRLAQMSEVEIGGLIYPNESKTKTHWLKPDFFPEDGGKKTILLLDEITSAPKRVQVAAYQLVLDRRIGRHKLPDDTVVIALGNRIDDGGVYVELAAPLADRFEIYDIDCSANIWLEDFANVHTDVITGKGVNPLVISYIQDHPSDLHTQRENSEDMVFATPRSWKRVSDTLNAANNLSAVVKNKVYGTIGDVLGAEFLTYCEKYQSYTLSKDVLAGKDVEVPTDRADLLYVISSLNSYMREIYNNSSLQEAAVTYNTIMYFCKKLPAEYAAMLQATLPSNADLLTEANKLDSTLISQLGSAMYQDLGDASLESDSADAVEAPVISDSADLDGVDLSNCSFWD